MISSLHMYNNGKKVLYHQFIADMYRDGINEPFTTFHENYTHWTGNPMTKNFVSRALGAIGLKAKMVIINFEGRKCLVSLNKGRMKADIVGVRLSEVVFLEMSSAPIDFLNIHAVGNFAFNF
ncbi:hypothetical protein GLOIN_2v1783702 [Rhizophagus irregularis DAOM 181602=DAOM 197198]|uniref:Uncharacterized protein n=2 Tax=Rhizophagus irregularis TaxID=588596 RepID=A0A015JX02_RHIIW|nr:hypothetical protein RirG_074500 [Rhizophagus irregularis DAOM 197198w]EXX71880.1 hypothetical protein RirG_074500 [Rhizophagus irregularis DAOM 197198w]GBC26504.1 hypothetical protein GLOIN_2v1783702 [Rhizophagus irregularis DAOM 181602=DAOM 197198]